MNIDNEHFNKLCDPIIFDIGDKCHIWFGDHEGETTEGTVVHIFNIENHIFNPHYVIAIPTGIDDIYEVRDSCRLGIRRTPIKNEEEVEEDEPEFYC